MSNSSVNTSQSSQFHKLPKLSLPIFTGNILEWQTFWDSFESSVHHNDSLSDIQRWSYLRSLLQGDAARVIEGFPLTHTNYIQAVELLKERFGQEHQIVNAYMQGFLELPRPMSTIVSLRTFQEAEKLWLLSCQSTSYHAEIISLKSKDKRTTLVKQLQLFLDQEGFIRCGGRIHNAPLTELTRFPYLLPAKHPLTHMIVLDAHATQLHAGTSALVSHIRQRYWIPSIRQYIQGLLKKCVTCCKVMGKPYRAPDPPPLPKIRVQDATPFTVTGVDFTEALHIRGKSGIENAYICLFTCASTRAVHLEVVPDLSTETFIQAFRRFASRKSLPRTMILDNAMTFSAAANTIQSLIGSTTVQDMLHRHGTEWRFIPKRAPWFG